MNKRELLSEIQVNYVDDVIVKRDIENLWMSRKEVLQVISELGQEILFVKEENQLDYLIREKQMTHLKRLGRLVTYQLRNTER